MEKKKMRAAVALKYDRQTGAAPTVVASGKGYVADKIIEMALENHVPVEENPLLAQSLAALQIGDEIPPDLYEAVAQLIVYVLHADKLMGDQQQV